MGKPYGNRMADLGRNCLDFLILTLLAVGASELVQDGELSRAGIVVPVVEPRVERIVGEAHLHDPSLDVVERLAAKELPPVRIAEARALADGSVAVPHDAPLARDSLYGEPHSANVSSVEPLRDDRDGHCGGAGMRSHLHVDFDLAAQERRDLGANRVGKRLRVHSATSDHLHLVMQGLAVSIVLQGHADDADDRQRHYTELQSFHFFFPFFYYWFPTQTTQMAVQ